MDWDLGFAAVGLLLAMSLGFGFLAPTRKLKT
jgi:hypothetical protein